MLGPKVTLYWHLKRLFVRNVRIVVPLKKCPGDPSKVLARLLTPGGRERKTLRRGITLPQGGEKRGLCAEVTPSHEEERSLCAEVSHFLKEE